MGRVDSLRQADSTPEGVPVQSPLSEAGSVAADVSGEVSRVSSPLMHRLDSLQLNGCKVSRVTDVPPSLEGREILRLDITDRDAFLDVENLRLLIPVFGQIIFDVFSDRQNPQPIEFNASYTEEYFIKEYFSSGDLGNADSVY